jgi:hypothetical protein
MKAAAAAAAAAAATTAAAAAARHPLDHHDKQEFKLTPGKGLLEPPVLNSKLNEVYRCVLKTRQLSTHNLSMQQPSNQAEEMHYAIGVIYWPAGRQHNIIALFNYVPTALEIRKVVTQHPRQSFLPHIR